MGFYSFITKLGQFFGAVVAGPETAPFSVIPGGGGHHLHRVRAQTLCPDSTCFRTHVVHFNNGSNTVGEG